MKLKVFKSSFCIITAMTVVGFGCTNSQQMNERATNNLAQLDELEKRLEEEIDEKIDHKDSLQPTSQSAGATTAATVDAGSLSAAVGLQVELGPDGLALVGIESTVAGEVSRDDLAVSVSTDGKGGCGEETSSQEGMIDLRSFKSIELIPNSEYVLVLCQKSIVAGQMVYLPVGRTQFFSKASIPEVVNVTSDPMKDDYYKVSFDRLENPSGTQFAIKIIENGKIHWFNIKEGIKYPDPAVQWNEMGEFKEGVDHFGFFSDAPDGFTIQMVAKNRNEILTAFSEKAIVKPSSEEVSQVVLAKEPTLPGEENTDGMASESYAESRAPEEEFPVEVSSTEQTPSFEDKTEIERIEQKIEQNDASIGDLKVAQKEAVENIDKNSLSKSMSAKPLIKSQEDPSIVSVKEEKLAAATPLEKKVVEGIEKKITAKKEENSLLEEKASSEKRATYLAHKNVDNEETPGYVIESVADKGQSTEDEKKAAAKAKRKEKRDAKRLAAAEAKAKKKSEREAKKLVAAEARAKKKEEKKAKRLAAAEVKAKKKAEREAKKLAAAEARAKKKEEKKAKRLAAAEAKAKKKAERDAKVKKKANKKSKKEKVNQVDSEL